jgi:hypothetical protein
MDFDKNFAEKYIKDLLKKYKIKVYKYSVGSSGKAKYKERMVKIPEPTNVDRFGVCLHEVKHILDGGRGRSFEKEFKCDMYALEIIMGLGYDSNEWEKRMRWHTLSRIAMAHNRGLRHDRINQDIRLFFTEVDFSKWIGFKVFVHYLKTNPFGYEIQYHHGYTRKEIEDMLKGKGLIMFLSDHDDSTNNRYIVTEPGKEFGPDFGNLTEIVSHFKLSKTTI